MSGIVSAPTERKDRESITGTLLRFSQKMVLGIDDERDIDEGPLVQSSAKVSPEPAPSLGEDAAAAVRRTILQNAILRQVTYSTITNEPQGWYIAPLGITVTQLSWPSLPSPSSSFPLIDWFPGDKHLVSCTICMICM